MHLVAFYLHCVAFGVNGGGLLWDIMYLTRNGESTFEYRGYGGKFKHLTFWDQVEMFFSVNLKSIWPYISMVL